MKLKEKAAANTVLTVHTPLTLRTAAALPFATTKKEKR